MRNSVLMKAAAVGKALLRCVLSSLGLFCVALTSHAQSAESEITPNRGYHLSGSYALGDIETINTTNGNLMLSIPLASLPAGRGGHPGFNLRLVYNSKIWDGQPDVAENPNNPNQTVNVVWLVDSDQGGWNYNLRRYDWYEYNRNSNGVVFQPPDCRNTNIWMMKVTFPDGSARQFRPYGFDDQCNDGYFTVRAAPGRSYYSTDGTFARLDFGASTSEWTLSFADGTRVVTSAGQQRTYDRNGNYTEILNVSNYNNTGHSASIISDQLGRSIVVEKGVGEDYVHASGVNGETLTTTVKWSSTFVKKTYRAGNHFQFDVNINNWGVRGVSEIVLPSQLGTNLKYLFGYNGWPTPGNTTPSVGWGELSSVTLPTGARADYQYRMDNESGPGQQAAWVLKNAPTRKDLNYNLEYDGNITPATTETWTYSIGDTFSQITAPDGGITKEWFTDIDLSGGGLVYKSEQPDGSVVERIWRENRPYLPPGVTIHSSLKVNSYVDKEFTSIRDAASTLVKTAIKEYRRDKNGNLVQEYQYDWVPYSSVARDGSGRPTGIIPAGAQLQRLNTISYYCATPDASDTTTNDPDSYDKTTAPSLRNAIASSETGSGALTLARSEFFYDNAFTTGNLTQQKSWDSTRGGYSNPLLPSNSISVSNQYDTYGNRTISTDARGFQMKLIYGSIGDFADLYPTEVINAFGTSIQRIQAIQYDFHTGLIKRTTDVDNNVSHETDYDALGRKLEVRSAANVAAVKSVTRMEYSAESRRVITRSDLNVAYDGKLATIQHYDQLGRVRLSRQLEDSSTESATDETQGIKVQTRYLFSGLNRYQLASNPFRAATSSAANGELTMGWTRGKSDNGGRPVELQTFAGASLPAPWGENITTTGTITTSYDANFTTTTDQNGKVRRSLTNALGQLQRVDEPDGGGSLGTIDSPAQPTYYTYDALGNLRLVTQGQQQRFFMYDSLSRLIRARNPEHGVLTALSLADPTTGNSQWSFGYSYDEIGNLTQKTDARGVVSTYAYDGLNRTTTRSYSDLTPAVTYSYDSSTISNGKGKLASISSSVSGYSYSGYDAMGRPLSGAQTIGSRTYTLRYSYDLSGNVKTIAFPSNHTVSLVHDDAGRTTSMTGNLGGGAPRNYATGIIYDAANRMTKEQFGTATPIYNKLFYNSRGQLSEIRESTSYTGPTDTTFDRGAIINHYSNQAGCWGASCNASDNNGNLMRQEVYIPNSDTFAQFYEYDSLNRLQSARETKNGGAVNWQQTYAYDRYGNRSINGGATFGQNINNLQSAVVANTTTNRMYAPGETEANHPLMNYDPAGNQIRDYFTDPVLDHDRTFDAENRMVSATTTSGQSNTYSYDGDGRRVVRNLNGAVTWQVYGFGGELLAEYAANTSSSTPQKEYGYRNGQLLITAGVTTGWGSPPVLNDNPLVASQTTVQARHISELRDAINALRSHLAMAAYSWQTSATTNDWISASPILEMRTALDQALGAPSGGYSVGLAQGLPIKAIHIQELRDRVLAAWISGGGVDLRWLVSDQLGTPRMVFDQSGSLATMNRHDYLPFGEELFAGTVGRTTGQGYTNNDGARQKFTQKERDIETALDYFLARYYSSSQGRFISVDPSRKSVSIIDPQSWNRYTYSLNKPLTYIDQNGKWPTKIHDLIVDRALPALSAAQRKEIKKGSWSVDDPLKGGQNTSRSNEHGMTIPGQSQDEAAVNADTFINNNVDAAKYNFTHHGLTSSLYDFGRAFHTVSDMTSPAHEGYQVWYVSDTRSHIRGESSINNFRMGLAVGATLALYKYTYGQAELQKATGYTPGSDDDPSVRAIRAQFSLPGSSQFAEAEALYDYRRGLQEGLNFDWGQQRGLRGPR